jgi:hypothetical protein
LQILDSDSTPSHEKDGMTAGDERVVQE